MFALSLRFLYPRIVLSSLLHNGFHFSIFLLEMLCSQIQLFQLRCLMTILDSYMFRPLLAIFKLSSRELKVLLYILCARVMERSLHLHYHFYFYLCFFETITVIIFLYISFSLSTPMVLYSKPPIRYLPWLHRTVGLEGIGPQCVLSLKHGADRS